MRRLPRILVLPVVAIAVACVGGGDDATESDRGSPTDPVPAATTTAAPTTTTPVPPPPDGAAPDAPGAPVTALSCFSKLVGAVQGPDYDQFAPTIAKSCAGTHHQSITGIEKLVFLGDSITEGTPPTLPNQYYRSLVTAEVQKRFPGVVVSSCSAWGARTDDFLEGKKEVTQCFPGATEPKKTLVVMTMGGNDIASWAKDQLSAAQATAAADLAAKLLRDAIVWMKAPGRFPKGVDVVFANVYEYTDASGDLLSCPAAVLGGLSGNWPQGAPAVVHFQEQYMKIATETKTDMIFLFEHFCGHGYRRDDPTLQCYRGPGAELWFDATCTHPSPTGHAEIAELFMNVIDGK